MTAPQILLDPDGIAVVSAETRIIDTERAFLQQIVEGLFPKERVLVRGRTLCRWVTEWALARRYTFESLESPRQAWRRFWPGWTDQDIEALQQRSGMRSPHDSAEDTLAAIFPTAPWHETIGVSHAARWMLWLANAEIPVDSPLVPLLRLVGQEWATRLEEDALCQDAYRLVDSPAAATFLSGWLFRGGYPVVFPIDVPESWERRAKTQWQFVVLRQGAVEFWKPVSTGRIHPQIRRVAAALTDDYLQQHPDEITADLLGTLRPHLSPLRWQALRRACPPDAPSPLSEAASSKAVLDWVRHEYLPFRQWQTVHGTAEHQVVVEAAAGQFADWLLEFYPVAINGGTGNDALVITAANALQADRSGVTLWVILDGMPVPDGEYVKSRLVQDERLTAAPQHDYFTCLPTITRFCKPALMNGRPPEYVNITDTPTPGFSNAVLLHDKTMRQQAAEAREGQVLVRSLKDPDAIYHRNQSRQTTANEVEGRLGTIVDQVLELVHAVPSHHELTLIVTTDHGRLLEEGIQRRHTVPNGAESEGRAVWGPFDASASDPPDSGVVSLSRERFRLPAATSVLVARDRSAFTQKNGASGTVSFPHGGLWPEEVVVPWMTFARDARAPILQIHVAGTGRTGGAGKLIFTIDNSGTTAVTVERLSLRSSSGQWSWGEDSGLAIAAQHSEIVERSIERWPRESEYARIEGTARVSLPNQIAFELTMEIALNAESLYRQTLTANDLLDL